MKQPLTGRLHSNILDKNFEAMIFPLNLMQMISLQPKYRVLDGFILRKGYFTTVLCVLGMVLMLFLHINKAMEQNLTFQSNFLKILHVEAIIDAIYYTTLILIMFIEHFINSKQSIVLIIKMNKIYRLLGSHTVVAWRNYNWIWFYLIFGFYLFFVFYHILMRSQSVLHFLPGISVIYLDVNMIYVTWIIKFLALEVNLWKLEVEGFQIPCSDINNRQLKVYFENRGKMLYKTYLNILEAFKLFIKLFHGVVFLFTVGVFIHTLFGVQIMTEFLKLTDGSQNTFLTGFTIFAYLLWTSKNVGLLCCLCAACQQFSLAVTGVNVANAIKLCEDDCFEDVRRLCKKVSNMNASHNIAEGMRACGVFRVDATLPVRLLQLLVIYTTVLLQFAFL